MINHKLKHSREIINNYILEHQIELHFFQFQTEYLDIINIGYLIFNSKLIILQSYYNKIYHHNTYIIE
jgi:hypothetical protein